MGDLLFYMNCVQSYGSGKTSVFIGYAWGRYFSIERLIFFFFFTLGWDQKRRVMRCTSETNDIIEQQ